MMKNTKLFIGIIIILILGIGFLVWERGQLKQQITEFSAPAEIMMPPFGFSSQRSFLPNVHSKSYQWDPFEEMDRLQREMNRMFRDSFWRGLGHSRFNKFERSHVFDPDADIKEMKEAYVIKLDIPGMDKADIDIELQDHNLIVSGKKSSDVEENKENKFYKKERSFGYFSRIIPLPRDASDESIQADYKKGVLTITVRKSIGQEAPAAKKNIKVI